MGNCKSNRPITCKYCKTEGSIIKTFHRCLPGVILEQSPQLPAYSPIKTPSDTHITLKIPQNKQFTSYKLKTQPKLNLSKQQLSNLLLRTSLEVKKYSFQQKFAWFHEIINKQLRIDFINGHQKIQVDPSNLIYSCKDSFLKIDLKKQLKVVFENNPTSLDAGGLLRQFFHMALKEIFEPDLGILKFCRTKQTSYTLNIAHCLQRETRKMYFKFLGKIVAKSFFERIPINCPLSRAVFRKLIGQPIYWSDFYDYDEKLYDSFRQILKSDCEELYLTFTISIPELNIQFHELIKNGSNIFVTNKNKQIYIKECINFLCSISVQSNLAAFADSFYEVIPKELIAVFEPYELKMMLNGPDKIDLDDWRQNTQYEGYNESDQVIQWFWKAMSQLDQPFLRNMLHNITGSNRVPVQGFKFLQSNRGQIKRFNIRKMNFENPGQLPLCHTCFNRLDLPQYKSFDKMESVILTICLQQVYDLGLQ